MTMTVATSSRTLAQATQGARHASEQNSPTRRHLLPFGCRAVTSKSPGSMTSLAERRNERRWSRGQITRFVSLARSFLLVVVCRAAAIASQLSHFLSPSSCLRIFALLLLMCISSFQLHCFFFLFSGSCPSLLQFSCPRTFSLKKNLRIKQYFKISQSLLFLVVAFFFFRSFRYFLSFCFFCFLFFFHFVCFASFTPSLFLSSNFLSFLYFFLQSVICFL